MKNVKQLKKLNDLVLYSDRHRGRISSGTNDMRPGASLPPISLLQENDIKEQPPKRRIYADFRGLFYSNFFCHRGHRGHRVFIEEESLHVSFFFISHNTRLSSYFLYT